MNAMTQYNFTIRSVEKDDYYKNHLSLYSQLTFIDPKVITKSSYDKFIDNLNSNHRIFVICENNKIIATGTILIEDKLIRNISKMAHIEDIVVDSEFRGFGLGKKLINFLVDYAKSLNCYKVTLNCNSNNIKFYENCNLVNTGAQMTIYFNSNL